MWSCSRLLFVHRVKSYRSTAKYKLKPTLCDTYGITLYLAGNGFASFCYFRSKLDFPVSDPLLEMMHPTRQELLEAMLGAGSLMSDEAFQAGVEFLCLLAPPGRCLTNLSSGTSFLITGRGCIDAGMLQEFDGSSRRCSTNMQPGSSNLFQWRSWHLQLPSKTTRWMAADDRHKCRLPSPSSPPPPGDATCPSSATKDLPASSWRTRLR